MATYIPWNLDFEKHCSGLSHYFHDVEISLSWMMYMKCGRDAYENGISRDCPQPMQWITVKGKKERHKTQVEKALLGYFSSFIFTQSKTCG